MFRKSLKKMMRSGKMMWILFMCLAVGAVVGTVYQNNKEQDVQIVNSGIVSDHTVPENRISGTKEEETAEKESGQSEPENSKKADAGQQDESKAVSSGLVKAEYPESLTDHSLHWPVEGEILREFSMDETVYFPTLNLYQCSSSILIQAEQGTPVTAPADAEVFAIGNSEELGTYLILSMGENYQVTLGQLEDIQVKKGEQVEAGEIIAKVSAPASCRIVEGDSLYMQLKEKGEAVDPLDYMEL